MATTGPTTTGPGHAPTKMADALSPVTPRVIDGGPVKPAAAGGTDVVPAAAAAAAAPAKEEDEEVFTIESLAPQLATGKGFLEEIRKMAELDSDGESSDDDAPVAGLRGSKEAAASPEGTATEQEWVQCEAPGCGKWRLLPPSICAEDLPEVFQCQMNYWDKKEASCAAPEVPQADAEDASEAAAASEEEDLLDEEEDGWDAKPRKRRQSASSKASPVGGKRAKRAESAGEKLRRARAERSRLTLEEDTDDDDDDDDEPAEPEAWRLIGTWVAVEFAAEGEDTDALSPELRQKARWWDCLVVDYDEEQSQHLVRWCKTDTEEWVPALSTKEIKPSDDPAGLAKLKTAAVVFDAILPERPPPGLPELVGQCYQVRKHVAVTATHARDSAEVSRCVPKQLIKALAAVELESGQVRVMFKEGWVSVASKKGATFLQKRQLLYLDKHDRRAKKKVVQRAREAETERATEKANQKLAAEAAQRLWSAAIASASRKLRAHLLMAGELNEPANEPAADAAAATDATETAAVGAAEGAVAGPCVPPAPLKRMAADQLVADQPPSVRQRVRKSRTIDDDDEGDLRDATETVQSVLMVAVARLRHHTARLEAAASGVLRAVLLAGCARQRRCDTAFH